MVCILCLRLYLAIFCSAVPYVSAFLSYVRVDRREGGSEAACRTDTLAQSSVKPDAIHLLQLQADDNSSDPSTPARAVIAKCHPPRVLEHARHGKLGDELQSVEKTGRNSPP